MILPPNKSAPTMTGAIERRVFSRLKLAAKRTKAQVVEAFDRVPRQKVDAETGVVVNVDALFVNRETVYEYQLSADILDELTRIISEILDANYLEITDTTGKPPDDWFMYQGVNLAYEQSTVAAVENLASQAPEYLKTTGQATLSPAYLNRIGFLRARVFEEMKGLTDQSRTDLADTLARGMAAGVGPLEIARNIRDRVDVSESRAQRIARTEINEAHRKAKLAEDQDAQQNYGLKTGILHLSALSPTTRRNHADLHGAVRTRKEVTAWYAVDGNAINCKCSEMSVVLDDEGKPRDWRLIKRLKEQKERYFGA